MLSLEAFRTRGWRFRFAAREPDAEAFIRARCAARGIGDCDVLTIAALTDGQATTALFLAQTAPADEPFAIYNIDTFVRPDAMVPPDPAFLRGLGAMLSGARRWLVLLPAATKNGNVVDLREKVRISDHATVGLYWFDSAARYVDTYRAYYSVPGREEKGERYVAPIYNQLIAEGLPVRIAELRLEDVGMLGTPDQVSGFVTAPPEAAQAVAAAFATR